MLFLYYFLESCFSIPDVTDPLTKMARLFYLNQIYSIFNIFLKMFVVLSCYSLKQASRKALEISN